MCFWLDRVEPGPRQQVESHTAASLSPLPFCSACAAPTKRRVTPVRGTRKTYADSATRACSGLRGQFAGTALNCSGRGTRPFTDCRVVSQGPGSDRGDRREVIAVSTARPYADEPGEEAQGGELRLTQAEMKSRAGATARAADCSEALGLRAMALTGKKQVCSGDAAHA